MTGQRVDPLADYSPDWRKRQGATADKAGDVDLRTQSPTADPLADYTPDWRKSVPPKVAADATSALPRNRANPSGDFESVHRGADALAGKALAAESNLIRGVKPLAMAQTGIRALTRGQSYDEAKADLEASDAQLPETVRGVIRTAGAAPFALAAPGATVGQAAASGMMFGAADAMTDDPKVSTGGAVARMAGGGAAGAAVGGTVAGGVKLVDKIREFSSLAGRVRKAPTLGKQAVEQDKAIEKATKENYGKVAEEAAESATRPTPAAVNHAFEDPDVAPFIEKVRASRRFKNANDATLAHEADKLMTKQRRGYQKLQKEQGFDADRDLKIGDLVEAQKVLRRSMTETGVEITTLPAVTTAQSPRPTTREALDAFDRSKGVAAARKEGTVEQQMARSGLERHHAESVVSPSLRGAPAETIVETEIPGMLPSHQRAISEKARMEGEREAGQQSQEHARRFMSQRPIRAKKQLEQSPEGVDEWIKTLNPGQLETALANALATGKEAIPAMAPLPWMAAGAAPGAFIGAGPGAAVGAAAGLVGNAGNAIVRGGVRLNRLSPFVRALDEQIGNPALQPIDLQSFIRGLLTLNAPFANHRP